ncbi:MAG: hypothetical protein S4CHLAM20_04200 [Chlamydiia bacterium]|nr:hypothetical protein [Chlamydiia bacterium]
MAVSIPKLKEIRDSIIQDLEGKLGITIPAIAKNFLNILAGVIAAKQWIFYLALAKLQKNIFVDTADPESTGGTLERFGRVKLNRNPYPASAGLYTIEVTGSIGAVINASTTWKTNDDSSNPGKLFILDDAFTFSSTTEQIQVRTLDVGSGTRIIVGDKMSLTSPVINVDTIGVTISEDQQPLEAETIEDYRAKTIEAYQLEPQGGASSDYRIWSADAQGVAKVYPYAKDGASAEVNLFVEATIIDSTDGKGTPSAALLDDVKDVVNFDPDITKPLNERGRRPLGAFMIYYLPITPKDINIEFVNFVNLTPAIEASVLQAITDYLVTVRPFVAGADVLDNRNDLLTVNDLTAVAIDAIPNQARFDQLVLKVDGISLLKQTFVNGNIPYLDGIIYL